MNRLPLGQLCQSLCATGEDITVVGEGVPVTGLCGDSRKVRPGDLFFATPGSRRDGLAFVDEAVARGAVGVVARERPALPEGVGFVGVRDVGLAKAVLADRFHGHPSGRLKVVGITGTNGKTTTSLMLRSMLTMDGRGSGLVGTLGAWIGSRHVPLANTTPDALELQRLLALMVDDNLQAAVLEVSSHALCQHRVHGIDVDVGVFTNLSQDHLDYHRDMASYAAAKRRLFEGLEPGATAVLNADDPLCADYARATRARVVRYGLSSPADVTAEIRRLDLDGTSLQLQARGLRLPVVLRLLGRHNVANALAAASAALALGVPPEAVATGLAAIPAVPGRLQPVTAGQEFAVLVDYAHTPDALEKVLAMLRPLARGQLIVVFGCGGDRDRGKRPLMGRAAAGLADRLVVTSDNPRSEDPDAIIDEILAGLDAGARDRTEVLPDRREAIASACRQARAGDVVLLAGKGHETTQTIGEQVLPFDDAAVAREVLWTL